MRRQDWSFLAAICAPGVAVLAIGAVIVWMEPRCLASHVEQKWVEYYCETVEIGSVPVGDISVPIYGTRCHEAHWEPVTVCDQWEAERQ